MATYPDPQGEEVDERQGPEWAPRSGLNHATSTQLPVEIIILIANHGGIKSACSVQHCTREAAQADSVDNLLRTAKPMAGVHPHTPVSLHQLFQVLIQPGISSLLSGVPTIEKRHRENKLASMGRHSRTRPRAFLQRAGHRSAIAQCANGPYYKNSPSLCLEIQADTAACYHLRGTSPASLWRACSTRPLPLKRSLDKHS